MGIIGAKFAPVWMLVLNFWIINLVFILVMVFQSCWKKSMLLPNQFIIIMYVIVLVVRIRNGISIYIN